MARAGLQQIFGLDQATVEGAIDRGTEPSRDRIGPASVRRSGMRALTAANAGRDQRLATQRARIAIVRPHEPGSPAARQAKATTPFNSSCRSALSTASDRT